MKTILLVFVLMVFVLSACGTQGSNPSASPQKIVDNSSMKTIPAGKFNMGSDPQTALAECKKYTADCKSEDFSDEAPIHIVSLSGFEMDIYEVTNADYDKCVTSGKCSAPTDFSPSKQYSENPTYDKYPVVGVTWFDANTYCSWRGARLPTEAEWEYAARGGVDGKNYPWGDVFEEGQANFCDTTCTSKWANKDVNDGYPKQSPVGSYPPNGFGLYDIVGNVMEWTADWYTAEYYSTVSAEVSNPQGPTSGDRRVIRGGSFNAYPFGLRLSNRGRDNPGIMGSDVVGFRCALSTTP